MKNKASLRVFGVEDEPRQVLIPNGVIKWRLRERNNDFARVYLKYPDRIESRYLMCLKDGTYTPGILGGVNKRQVKKELSK